MPDKYWNKESYDIYGNLTVDKYGKGYRTGTKSPKPQKVKRTKVQTAPYVKKRRKSLIFEA